MTDSHSSPNPQSLIPNASPILWALFLACSWTWCIGMFLPALLLRDAGWMGYLVFFLPNVIGAGAMGFVLRSPEAAARIAERHAPMARVFSIVTLAFHAFWLAWLFGFFKDAFPIPDTWLMGAAAAGIAWIILSGRVARAGGGGGGGGAVQRAAAVLWIIGLATAIALLASPNALEPSTAAMIAAPTHPDAALWLMPVTVFGFLLCPYLDLTFLLARRSTHGVSGGRLAFGLGFWLFFPVMIGLTALYAGPIIAVLEGRTPPAAAPWAGAAILFHIIAQWTFTVRVHLASLSASIAPDLRAPSVNDGHPDPITTDPAAPLFPKSSFILPTTFAACLGAAGLGLIAPGLPAHADLSAGEIIYRSFLAAYGLLFPVYVWSRVIPRRRQPTHAAWITACVLAAPFYWMGFIEREGVWLAPGILIAMVVPLLKRSKHEEESDIPG